MLANLKNTKRREVKNGQLGRDGEEQSIEHNEHRVLTLVKLKSLDLDLDYF